MPEPVWTFRRKQSLIPVRKQTPDHPACSPVTIPTQLTSLKLTYCALLGFFKFLKFFYGIYVYLGCELL